MKQECGNELQNVLAHRNAIQALEYLEQVKNIVIEGGPLQSKKIDLKMIVHSNSEVLTYIVSKKGLLHLFSFALFSNFLLAPLSDILMPYILKKEIGYLKYIDFIVFKKVRIKEVNEKWSDNRNICYRYSQYINVSYNS
ncbi:hypothetical protein [Anaerosacchariphilus polymeriproducens]|uniref:Uncharacterized protein n=1 Tax=Anaerosacchariphilus polymeriproducens TaxID=1812858 RepID=A0A371AZZ5_9FIRM|nr:hypothetical protein [Anaerosacchariphilus polymeriproducens]RDU25188.1 hypothetical protein DWV06_00485 [Anaerosacchariphilus polymeriproducens]